MNRFLYPSLLASLLAAMAGNAMAYDTGLTLTGNVSPSACSVTLPPAGVQLGTIDMGSLHLTQPTFLASKKAPYIIQCAASMRVGHHWRDDAADSVYGQNPAYFGLGKQGDASIGYMRILHSQIVNSDQALVRLIRSSDNGASWTSSNEIIPGNRTNSLYAYEVPGMGQPVARKIMAGELVIHPTIAPRNTLDASRPATIAGEATLELVYL